MIRVAAVPFLNAWPLIHDLELDPACGIALDRALPSALRDHLADGRADVALMPVVDLFAGAGAGVLGTSGIACRGPVGSVKLFFTGDPGAQEAVRVDRGSHTSVALLRILLAEEFGCEPEILPIEPTPDVTASGAGALLVIGDRCFEFERHLRDRPDSAWRSRDLGEWWFERTGYPFVFAAWTVARRFLERRGLEEVRALGRRLDEARDAGLADVERIAARAALAGRLGVGGEATQEAIVYYFRESLRYRIGREESAGLRLFHAKCVAHGLVPDSEPPLTL